MTMRKGIICLIASLLSCVPVPQTLLSAVSSAAKAEALKTPQSAYEQREVTDDLINSVIGGERFELADYPHKEGGKPRLIAFTEFCYSYYADKRSDYGLYAYIYNPCDAAIDTSSPSNRVQLSSGTDPSYRKYGLEFVRYSEKPGYEGRFYKFRLNLTERDRNRIRESLEETGRVYRISGIELTYGGRAEEYPCGQSYTYKGYAMGYGSALQSGDTLTCTVDGLEKYLTADVRATYYRPRGTNGEAYERDTLHSVYFSVPDSVISECGEMTAVHATWQNALTEPILITGNRAVYEDIQPYIGREIDGGNFTYAKDDRSPVRYALIAGAYNASASWNNASYGSAFISYNENANYTNSKKRVTNLKYCFLAEGNDSDNYTLPAEALIGNKASGKPGYFETYTQIRGGRLICGKYSEELFEKTSDRPTDVTITADDEFTLTDEVASQSLWQKFVGGGYNVTDTNEYKVSAIRKVREDDFKPDYKKTCESLYIDESDYPEFRKYYDSAVKKKETVYLFRYYQSGYTSYESIEYKRGEGDWTLLGTQFGYEYVDTNACFMQMWVQLDFDIIDLTFTKNGAETVIPVVMTPLEITADGQPPVITSEEPFRSRGIALGIIGLILIVWLLVKLLPLLITALCKIIALPIKAVSVLRKSRSPGVGARSNRNKSENRPMSPSGRREHAESGAEEGKDGL